MASLSGYTSQLAGLLPTGGGVNPPQASLLALLVANVGPASEEQSTSQMAAVTARDGLTLPKTSQVVALTAYATSVPEDPSQRAWTFDLDGHTFYVLTLGDLGTVVYDFATDQWSQWGTEGYPVWNAEHGTMWRDQIVAADVQSPQVYVLDPTASLDQDFRPLRRKATAILPNNSLNYIAMDSLFVDASIGDGQTGFDGTATLTLRYSDDQGQNWITFGSEEVSSTDDSQVLMFRSVGSFRRPGRIIEIEDLGGPVRIDGVDVVLR